MKSFFSLSSSCRLSLLLFSYLSVFPFLTFIPLAVFHPPSSPIFLLFLTPFNISSMSFSLHPSLSLWLHYILSAWTLKLTILARPLLQRVHDKIQFNKVAMTFCPFLCAGVCVAAHQVLQTKPKQYAWVYLTSCQQDDVFLRFDEVQQQKLLGWGQGKVIIVVWKTP